MAVKRGGARVNGRKKRRKMTAIVMVLVMVMSLFSTIGIAVAEPVTDFAVTINFYAFDQTTLTAPEPRLNNGRPHENENYHVVVTLKDKQTGDVAGYGFAVIDDINKATQTLHITEFWTTSETGNVYYSVPDFVPLEYDPDRYEASGVRLYYGKSPARKGFEYPGVGYSKLIAQTDTIDGYIFMSSAVTQNSGEINLYKGTQEYAVRIAFDPRAGSITADDGYYILVSAKHKSNTYSYYFAPLETNGTDSTVDFVVKNGNGVQGIGGVNGDWINNNGHATTEKYTGNWDPITVKILKAKPGTVITAKKAIDGNDVAETTTVKEFTVSYEGITKVRDEEKCVVENCDVVKLSEVVPAKDYDFLSILGDAVNYGIVAAKITQSNHSETNFATKVYSKSGDFNFDPDLSGNGSEQVPGNYLVGTIESDTMRFGNETPATAIVFVGEDSAGKVVNEAAPENVMIITMDKDDIDSAVDDLISHMKQVSSAMAAKKATMAPVVMDNTVYLDTSGFDDGVTIYIDADAYNGPDKPFSKDGGLHIKMKPSQTIVFNFKTSENVVLSKTFVDFCDGTGEHSTDTVNGKFGVEQNIYADKINRQLVWNCAKASVIDTHISGGMYLAPLANAKMTLGDTTTGWGVCTGEVTMGKTSEFHFVYQGLSKEKTVTAKSN